MRPAESITSNATGLFYTAEAVPGVTPVNPVWTELEPNSYANFGTDLKTSQRMPINADRRNKKGTVVGYTAGAGFETDLTATNLVDLVQGFFFSSARTKSKLLSTAATANGFTVAAGGLAFPAGTLIGVNGATDGPNNGLHIVSAGSTNDNIEVAGLTVAAGQSIVLSRVGIQFDVGDAVIDASGALPALKTTTFDMTTLGLIPGEIVYLGGDGAAMSFPAGKGNGWCRVKSVSAHALVFDKTDFVFQSDPGAGKTIQMFFGTVVRDEDYALQVQRSYSIMRHIGKPDLDSNAIQAEVVTRCVANKIQFKVPEEDKITCDLTYMGADANYYDDVVVEVPGSTYIGITESDAINSSGDMKRATMFVYPQGADSSAPVPLFAVFNKFDLTLDNQIKENKAVTRLGTFVLSPGNFKVTGNFTGYFVDVAAQRSVRNNADVTFMAASWKANKGIAIDLPMLTLASKGLEVKINEPVMIPLDTDASTGRKYDANMSHTALMVFFDYLPNVAND